MMEVEDIWDDFKRSVQLTATDEERAQLIDVEDCMVYVLDKYRHPESKSILVEIAEGTFYSDFNELRWFPNLLRKEAFDVMAEEASLEGDYL